MCARSNNAKCARAAGTFQPATAVAEVPMPTKDLLSVVGTGCPCSRSMNELNRYSLQPNSVHCEYLNEIRRSAIARSNANLFAGPLIINDRILPDDEIGLKVVAKIFSKVKNKIFKSSEDLLSKDECDQHERAQRRQQTQSMVSATKREHHLQRMESRQSSTSQSKRDSIQSNATGYSLLKRFKTHGRNEATSRNCSVDCDSHDSHEIVIRAHDLELAKQQYDRDSSQLRLASEADALLQSPIRQRSLSLSLRQQPAEKQDNEDCTHTSMGVPPSTSEGGAAFSGIRRMTSPSTFSIGQPKTQRNAESIFETGDRSATPFDGRPSKKVSECSYDKHGMTWDVYGADVDAEVLGLLIQSHLQRMMKENSHVRPACPQKLRPAPPPPKPKRHRPLAQLASRLCSCCRSSS